MSESSFSKAVCISCKKEKPVNSNNQCFDCWNFILQIKKSQGLQKQWRNS